MMEVDRCVYNTMVDTDACRKTQVDRVQSAHFTVCQKPWDCYYPHPKQSLCTQLFDRWYALRAELEGDLGIPQVKACTGGGKKNYHPIALSPAPESQPL